MGRVYIGLAGVFLFYNMFPIFFKKINRKYFTK